jgi:hypothetical protein
MPVCLLDLIHLVDIQKCWAFLGVRRVSFGSMPHSAFDSRKENSNNPSSIIYLLCNTNLLIAKILIGIL